ncbi:hypothetical protein GDO81_013736 [Engystomops pustulosus]|uniref:Peptidase S1 domain-containing protein n=1 Tax=Engystomops pustulosus TaxID=76066 RepID=A0AAV7B568_ENGPU|nr:hypothetical protein GDO81_013736 [Engystomops pustulosus]
MHSLWVLMFLGIAVAIPLNDDDKIINGYECSPHSQPWQVYFTYNGNRWCGGSLITARWIISAAHCYKQPKTLIAHLGEHDTSKEEGTEQHIQVEKAYQYFYYSPYYIDNDFMMVKLAEPAQFNQYVQPINIASSCPTAGSKCLVSGWGNLKISGGRLWWTSDLQWRTIWSGILGARMCTNWISWCLHQSLHLL